MRNIRIGRYKLPLGPVSLIGCTFLLLRFILLIGYVPSESMEPTIHEGSLIVGYRLYDELERGDVVIFRKDGKLQVKRIVGLPGDTVHWNAIPYITDYPRPVRPAETARVPDGCYFLLGDNTQNSFDSRYWADPFIPESDIVARMRK